MAPKKSGWILIKKSSKTLALLPLSIGLLTACEPSGSITQAVKVDSPKLTDSNNSVESSQVGANKDGIQNNQSNTGSGEQNNTNNTTTSQTSSSNSGSGQQINQTNSNTNSGSGTQVNTSVAGNQTNTTVGNQTNIAGNQNNTTVGNQTNTQITNHSYEINVYNTIPVDDLKEEVVDSPKASAVDGSSTYTQSGSWIIKYTWEKKDNADSYLVLINGEEYTRTDKNSIELEEGNIIVGGKNIALQEMSISIQSISKQEIEIQEGEPAPPSPTPIPLAPADISIISSTSFTGVVYDDMQNPIPGLKISTRSLSSSTPYEHEAVTNNNGEYTLYAAPAGIQLEIVASRPGYTTRRQVEVLKSNKQGDPNANRYDFGIGGSNSDFGVGFNALSDKPEVTMVTPGRNSSGVDPSTSFVIKFSEPMDRKTVTDNFEVRAYTSKSFSVDSGATLSGSNAITSSAGDRVWDKAAFNASWNSDDTEVTMSFKEERLLPTDKDSDKTPDYQITLERQDSQLKDKSGITRASDYFKLTDGNFERSYKFSINTDEQKPTLSSLVAQTAENSGSNSDGDAIKVRFSERMIHYTLSPTIAGGKNGVTSQAAGANNGVSAEEAAMNYKVTVIRSGDTQLNQATWASLGGRAIFDANDPTHKTVILLPPSSATDLYKPGDNVIVEVETTVVDPAGNSMAPNNNDAAGNAS